MTRSLLSSTAAFRIGAVVLSRSTFIATLARMALAGRSPGLPCAACTAGVSACTSAGRWPGRVVLSLIDLMMESMAPQAFKAEHHEERHVQHCHSIFETRDGFLDGEIAGVAADEHVAARGIEAEFRCDARVGAAQHRGKRILALGERFALVLEVVPPADAFDVAGIALHQLVKGGAGVTPRS